MDNRECIKINQTIEYYDANASDYCESTKDIDMSALYHEFQKAIPNAGKILDLGCGSGRDSKYFLNNGFDVISIDASPKMCDIARSNTNNPVLNMNLEDIEYHDEFDGIWACASLLHVPKKQMMDVMQKIRGSLKQQGVLYASWKLGNGEEIIDGRFFSYYSGSEMTQFLHNCRGMVLDKIWITEDLCDRHKMWINILAHRVY